LNWERRKGTTPSGEGRPRKAHGRKGGARKVEQDGAMFRPRVDIILTRQPSFDPSPAHVVSLRVTCGEYRYVTSPQHRP
jgi:hypothetical protein